MPVPPKLIPLELDGYTLHIGYYLTQEYADIGQACAEIPPVVEWVNTQLQQMVEWKLIAKQEIKEQEAEVYFELRDGGFRATYADKMTEGALDRAICRDERVKKAHRDYARLAGWVQRLTNLQFSLQAKLELVRSTEATRRRMVEDHNDSE